MRPERFAAGFALPLVLILFVFAAACGGSSAEGAKNTAPPAAQQSAGGDMPSLSGAAAAGGPATPSPAPATVLAEPVSEITVIAIDNAYAPAAFRVRAGEEVSLTLENRGQAIHDWRILNLKRADGKDAGTTLLTGGKSETITFTIPDAGEYTFYCEVHPVEMRGRLTVQ